MKDYDNHWNSLECVQSSEHSESSEYLVITIGRGIHWNPTVLDKSLKQSLKHIHSGEHSELSIFKVIHEYSGVIHGYCYVK